MSAARLQSPIVLAHGLLGFAKLELAGRVLVSYFHRIPELLESAGNVVFATSVPPTRSIADRAAALSKAIGDRFGAQPVHIIAHSMGGLDARYMISRLEGAPSVLSLTTLGTPHRGTVLAERALELAGRSGLLSALRLIGIPDAALHDLTRARMAAFNADAPDAAGVRYFSVAGKKRRGEMLAPLVIGHDVIEPVEGDNDGLVSVRSALWGERCDVWDCDHVNMIGWSGPMARLTGHAFDVEEGYGGILETLSRAGF